MQSAEVGGSRRRRIADGPKAVTAADRAKLWPPELTVARFNKREEAKFLSAVGSRKERKAIKERRGRVIRRRETAGRR
jgi:hypothetical protein